MKISDVKKYGFLFAFAAALLMVSPMNVFSEVARKTYPTGLLDIAGFKYQVFLYVPEDLNPEKKYPMLLMAPGDAQTAEEHLEFILEIAREKSYFVLAPYSLWPRDTPYAIDEWLIQVKDQVAGRFPVDRDKIFVMGRESGAEYASYLATQYPHEFSGAALLGGAWSGFFERIIVPKSGAENQVPFYVAFTGEHAAEKSKNEEFFAKFQEKGYPIYVVNIPAGQDYKDFEFQYDMLDWLDKSVGNWNVVVDEASQTWKSRFKKGFHNFFLVEPI